MSEESTTNDDCHDEGELPTVFLQPDYDDDIIWVRGKFLGKGGFSQVYELINEETGERVAGKIVNKSVKNTSQVREEIKMHRLLDHPRVVKYLSHFEVEYYFVILLELCENRSMLQYMKERKRLSEAETQTYLAHTVEALQYLHGMQVVHCDIKLGNLFLDANMQIKVGDFGMARREYNCHREIRGTPNYLSPEVLNQYQQQYAPSYPIDIWALGVTMYIWLTGRVPFRGQDEREGYSRIQSGTFSWPLSVAVLEDAQDLVGRMLQLSPMARPTLPEIMQHPFMVPTTSNPIPINVDQDSVTYTADHHIHGVVDSGDSHSNDNNAKTSDEALKIVDLFPQGTDPNAQ